MPRYDEYDDFELPDVEPDWEYEAECVFSSGIVRAYCPGCPGEDMYEDIDTESEFELDLEDLPAPEEAYEPDQYDDDCW